MPARGLPALVALGAMAIAMAAGLLLQRQSGAALRAELEMLKEESRERTRLRDENARLVSQQIPAAELERLRADHAALVRLRGEIEELKSRARQMAQKGESR